MATDPPNPRDILALQSAVNDASSRATALWVSFMTFTAYLIVAVGSVNHVALFKELPIKLPVISAEIPLVAFFAIAPFFLILFHFYIFLNLLTLSRRILTYNQILGEDVAEEVDRNLLRARLDTFIVVQLLSRPSKIDNSPTAWLLSIVVWITLVAVPIVLLLQFQLTFLPYHDSLVTWVHRFLIVADLALIWLFWFAISSHGELHLPKLKGHLIAVSASVTVAFISIVVVSYPGERIGRLVIVPIGCSDKPVPISDCFLHGPVNMVTGRPRSPFFNVLVLPGQTLTDPKKVEADQETATLRGRDLVGAILSRSDMRLMDFTGTNLDGARLDRANASGAVFGCDVTGERQSVENANWPDHGCSSLRGASLYGANLSGAKFIGAHMEGSVLIDANLSGARLGDVHLQASVLTNANLTAAYLRSARMQNAYLFNTNFSGATLEGSQLHGALLEQSQFQFASFGQFIKVGVRDTVGQPQLSFAAFDLDASETSTANVTSFTDMRKYMLNVLHEEEIRRDAWQRLGQSDLRIFKHTFYEDFYVKEMKTNWGQLKVDADDLWNFIRKGIATADTGDQKDMKTIKAQFLADRFSELACDSENAPFVARGLISNEIIIRAGTSLDTFLTKVRDTASCRGAVGLKPQDYGTVLAMRNLANWENFNFIDKSEIPPPLPQ